MMGVSVGGDERGGCGDRVLQGEFLQEQRILGLEVWVERMAATKMQTDVGVALVEASDEVDDERAVGDHLTEVAEIICHTLESPAVVGDGEVTLLKPRNWASR